MKKRAILVKRARYSKATEITGASVGGLGYGVVVWLKTDDSLQGIEITGDRQILTRLFRDLAHKLEGESGPATSARRPPPSASDWEWLTPQMVIEKFESSEVLRPHLADVIKALLPAIRHGESSPAHDLAGDLDRVRQAHADAELVQAGEPKWGAQAKVARALGVSNAGSHRKRIIAIIEYLKGAEEVA